MEIMLEWGMWSSAKKMFVLHFCSQLMSTWKQRASFMTVHKHRFMNKRVQPNSTVS